MKNKNKIIAKYHSIFGIKKDYLEILEECHNKIKSFENKTFSIIDFKNDKDYESNLLLIDEFRKYSKMDDFSYKGTKGKIINLDKGVTIKDEFGNIHQETFQSIRRSGWKHVSTLNYERLYSQLSLEEKAHFDNHRNNLSLIETKNS